MISGFRIDISWALRQMEPEQLGATKRGSQIPDGPLHSQAPPRRCSVVVDNLVSCRWAVLC